MYSADGQKIEVNMESQGHHTHSEEQRSDHFCDRAVFYRLCIESHIRRHYRSLTHGPSKGRKLSFHRDNNCKPTLKMTQDWLKKVKALACSSKSPDLNLFEK